MKIVLKLNQMMLKKSKEDWIGNKEDTDYVCRFLNEYEMTGNPENFIESNKIIEWITINNLGISMTKMGMELNKYCIINYVEGVHKHF